MKLFTKLALVSAIAISGNVMAMESLDDAALSAATGQDGIDLTIKTSGISIAKILVHDNDGLALTAATNGGLNLGGTATAGAIVVNNVTVGVSATQANPLMAGNLAKVTIDTDGGATGNAVLNINMDMGNTTIAVGSIGVAASANAGKTLTERTNVLDIGNVTLNGLKVNVQLGSQPQGALIKVNSVITGGLNLSNVALKGTAGDISLGAVNVKSAGTNDLTLALSVDPIASGLKISGLGNIDVASSALKLGDSSATALGAMYISNLSVGDMTISGH